MSRKIITALVLATAAAGLSVGTASIASAQQSGSYALSPGQSQCTAPQYASYQVRGEAQASTADGAKFKLVRNGVVVANTPTRQPTWTVEQRTTYGTFSGPGYYSLCAQNTGTKNTIATLILRTDYEF